MASEKLSALVDLAGGQAPNDQVYVNDVSAGVAGSKRSTLNDLFSIITKNITDGALRFQGFAAPVVSAAGQAAIYFDSTDNRVKSSENAGAYVNLGNVSGPATATDNAIVRFDGATGKLIQNSVVSISDTGNVTGLGTLNTHTIPGGTDTFTLLAATQTLTNKTLTSPIINQINDANGNEEIVFIATASAINELTIANAATGGNPTISASGGDAAIGVDVFSKGAGRISLNLNAAPNFTTAFGTLSHQLTTNTANTRVQVIDGGAVFVDLILTNNTGVLQLEANSIAPKIGCFSNTPLAIVTNNAERARFTNNAFLVNTTTENAQLYAVSGSTTRVGVRVDSAASPTVDIAQFTVNGSATDRFSILQDGFFSYPGYKRTTADFSKTSDTTLANITGLSVNVRSGRTYAVKVKGIYTADVAGGVKLAIAGTATASFVNLEGYMVDNGGNALASAVRITALGTAHTFTGITDGYEILEGVITASASGTLTVQFAQNVSNATPSTVLQGATWEVVDIT